MKTKKQLTAIIYNKRGRVLSIGKNNYLKTHPLQKKHAEKAGEPLKICLHAEISAIIKCKDLAKAYRIVITRFGKTGEPLLAKPCKTCQSAIRATPIKIIEHT